MKKEKNMRKTMMKDQSKPVVTLYFVLRFFVLVSIVINILRGNWENVFLCFLTLLLFLAPFLIEKKLKIELPSFLEITLLLFIFAAEILGEIQAFYMIFPRWDDILHTINGFIMAMIGFSLVNLLNKSDLVVSKLTPLFVVFVSFCFSMTIGIAWEFFEYGMDTFFKMDMQKDTVIQEIHSVNFDPEGKTKVVTIPIQSVVVNGEEWQLGGYLDIGLNDTMHDLIVNFIGASVFSVIGYYYLKKETMPNHFLIRSKKE